MIGQPTFVDGAGIAAVGDVVVSVHRRSLTAASLDAFDEVSARVTSPDYCTFSVYRLERVRRDDFADDTVRKRIVAMGHNPRLRRGIAVLDGAGLANAGVRLALAGVLMLLPGRRSLDSAASIDEGLAALQSSTKTDPAAIRAVLDQLIATVWAPGS